MAVYLVTVMAAGCAQNDSSIRQRLESYDPTDRVRAVTDAARSGDPDLASALVDRLDDEDSAVRFYAILALEKLTATRLGYSYGAPAAERRESVDAWRDFLRRRALPQNNARVASSDLNAADDSEADPVDDEGPAVNDATIQPPLGEHPAGLP
jgi:hypothetical protein